MTVAPKDDDVNFGFGPIYHDSLPEVPWAAPHTRRLPGVQPLDPADWLRVDETFAGQMALRDHMLNVMPDTIMAQIPGAKGAIDEVYHVVTDYISQQPGYRVQAAKILRPDGVAVRLADPLSTLLRLVAEDLCILQKQGDDYVMVAATLAFPGGWTLSQKIGCAMTRIHAPVGSYDDNIAQRVRRMFDAIRPERPLTRTNAFTRSSPELFRPRLENDQYPPAPEGVEPLVRTERQCLVRMPESDAIVFSIQTRIAPISVLTDDQAQSLKDFPIGHEQIAHL